MDEYGEHIVLAADDGHVVQEGGGVHLAVSASQHLDDVVLQPLIVHLDVVGHGIVGTCAGPVTAATAASQSHHHRVGVEHRRLITYLVAIIPLHQFVFVHLVFLGQCFYFLACESEVLRHVEGFHHRILHKIVECRLGLILLDGENARHIDTCEGIAGTRTFEHASQPVHIVVHGRSARLELSADGIPLVDDEDELLACGNRDAHKAVHQVVVLAHGHLWVGFEHFGLQRGFDMGDNALVLEAGDELRHVEVDDRVFVQMLLKRWVLRYLQVAEQAARVARMVVIGTKHPCCQRFSEAAAAGDTTELPQGIQCIIHYGYQS